MRSDDKSSSSGKPAQSADQTASPAVSNVSGGKPVFPSNSTVRVGLEVKSEKTVKDE
jgi:hypothetical protein